MRPRDIRSGFTLIEILLVTGFGLALGTFMAINLFSWREEREISATAQQIATVLREAESRAISQSDGKAWGVHFEHSFEDPYFTLFTSGGGGTTTTINRYLLPNTLTYGAGAGSLTFPQGTSIEIVFDQITGKPRIVHRGLEVLTICTRRCPIDEDGNVITEIISYVTKVLPSLNLNVLVKSNTRSSSTVTVSDIGTITFNAFVCRLTCSQETRILPPELALLANPSSVNRGETATLTWSASGASSCVGSWTGGSTAGSGSVTVRPLETTAYSMTCAGDGGTTARSVTITVMVPTPPPGGGGGGGGGGGDGDGVPFIK